MAESHPPQMPRDHGGDTDTAMRRHGGRRADWIDLSTGINALPYPVPDLPPDAWTALPRQSELRELQMAAAQAYRTGSEIVPMAGAQAVIQIVPFLRPPGHARVLAPTYNEHEAALRRTGWRISQETQAEALGGADLAVVVNPNNPDGRQTTPDYLLELSRSVGMLIVDESFADTEPALSLAPYLGPDQANIVVLRSFGKFYGLAGLRLGFALATGEMAARLRGIAGPWPVSGPAISIASRALRDIAWQDSTADRLRQDAARMDGLAELQGWELVGGTSLFRTYSVPDAAAAQAHLARHRIWTRIFPYSARWLRLGLPGPEDDWQRLACALAAPG
ncbi:MAG: threonine-phosphate decarboxylase CobD [Paracoccaceae bacterium]